MSWGYKCECGEEFLEGNTVRDWETSDAFGPRIQDFVVCPACDSADHLEEAVLT